MMKFLLSLLIIVVVILGGTFDKIFDIYDFSFDEGLNAMKALLVAKGHRLYSEIWSDQPPFFTLLLAPLYKLFGNSIVAFRLTVLFIFYLALLALHSLLSNISGKLTAFIAVSGLVLCSRIVDYSVLVLIGLPSICFSILSLWILNKSDRSKAIDLHLVGAAMIQACALNTKIWVVLIFLCQIIQLHTDSNMAIRRRRTVIFTVLTFLFSLAILKCSAVSITQALEQLTVSHYAALTLENQPRFYERVTNSEILLYISALISAFTYIAKDGGYRLFLNWLIFATIFLSFHQPIWDHHFVLLDFPAVIMSAYAVSLLIKNRFKHTTALIASLFFISSIGKSAFESRESIPCVYCFQVDKQDFEFIKGLPKINYILTNLPYYAFLINKPVPPETAVISSKRLTSGRLEIGEFSENIRKYKPEVMLFSPATSLEEVVNEVSKNTDYVRIHSDSYNRIFVLKNLSEKSHTN